MSFVHHLEPTARQRLFALGEDQDLAAGETLVRRGDLGGDIWLVHEGEIVIAAPSGGSEFVLETLGPGEVIGELGFIDRNPRAADVRALTPARCTRWRREALLRALARDPGLAAATYAALAATGAERLRASDAALAATFTPAFAPDPSSDPVLAELVAVFDQAWSDGATGALATALGDFTRVLGPVVGTRRADELGAGMRRLLGGRLRLGTLSAALLDRPRGTPAGPAVWDHLSAAVPSGATDVAASLDQAMLRLPTLHAVAWRAERLVSLLTEQRITIGDTVALLAPGHERLHGELARVLAGRGGTLLALGQDDAGAVGLDQLLALAAGILPGSIPPLRAAVIDGLTELLPDCLLVGLLAALRPALGDGGRLFLGASGPSSDAAVLDALFRWPLVLRTPEAMLRLVRAAGFEPPVAHRDPRGGPGFVVVAGGGP